MDQKQIEKLMSAMEQSRIKRIVLKKEDFEIEIERESATGFTVPVVMEHHTPHPTAHPTIHLPKVSSEINPLPEYKEKASGSYITSPMVGTFYATPAPDEPPFVKVGDSVTETSVVCIIEAMKVMNEVKANVKGVIAEILIKNGEPCEFGTQMFRVTPT